MKMYEVYEPIQTVDWEKDTLVESECFYYSCEEHQKYCNEGTRFVEVDVPADMCRWCSISF